MMARRKRGGRKSWKLAICLTKWGEVMNNAILLKPQSPPRHDIPPSIKPHLLIFSNSSTNWGPSIRRRSHSYSNHHRHFGDSADSESWQEQQKGRLTKRHWKHCSWAGTLRKTSQAFKHGSDCAGFVYSLSGGVLSTPRCSPWPTRICSTLLVLPWLTLLPTLWFLALHPPQDPMVEP